MRLRDDLYLVGGGHGGFDLSPPKDCHVYLLDGGDDLTLIDAGLGLDGSVDRIIDNVRRDGLDPNRIARLLLTHYHGDHVGGAPELAQRLRSTVHGSPLTAQALSTGDEGITSVALGKQTGLYPAEFALRPIQVQPDLVDGAILRLGCLTLKVFDTPGHCHGHVSFWLDGPFGTAFIGGDLIAHGGRVFMQSIPDCSIWEYRTTIQKLAGLTFDAFLPGHHAISLSHGSRHLAAAVAYSAGLALPPNAINQPPPPPH